MSQNMNRHLTALEFDKILERLAQFTACPDARELARELCVILRHHDGRENPQVTVKFIDIGRHQARTCSS